MYRNYLNTTDAIETFLDMADHYTKEAQKWTRLAETIQRIQAINAEIDRKRCVIESIEDEIVELEDERAALASQM